MYDLGSLCNTASLCSQKTLVRFHLSLFFFFFFFFETRFLCVALAVLELIL